MYLSWLEMDRNIEQYKRLLDWKYNEKEPCYCNTPNMLLVDTSWLKL